ncbi:MAG: helix-turn-helix transcriptional regulator [Bacteroidetes bacterium]|nr:helix-turn-helix transcriptional regulator [Bacteroidota bacterium]
MTTKKSARTYSSIIINQLLGETSPAEQLQVKTKMTLAARLNELITARGLGKSEFAATVKKSPSEITRWLSGTQNFTIDTLSEIATALEVSVEELFTHPQAQVFNQVQAS